MIALIGPPPQELVRRSETTEQCFDLSGKYRDFKSFWLLLQLSDMHAGAWVAHEEAVIPLVSLESLEMRLSGKEKASFVQFMRSMLQWLPEKRKTARQLLEDPWLL